MVAAAILVATPPGEPAPFADPAVRLAAGEAPLPLAPLSMGDPQSLFGQALTTCGLVCNGTNGTAQHPNGGDGGILFGNGGDGYTVTSSSPPGAVAGLFSVLGN